MSKFDIMNTVVINRPVFIPGTTYVCRMVDADPVVEEDVMTAIKIAVESNGRKFTVNADMVARTGEDQSSYVPGVVYVLIPLLQQAGISVDPGTGVGTMMEALLAYPGTFKMYINDSGYLTVEKPKKKAAAQTADLPVEDL